MLTFSAEVVVVAPPTTFPLDLDFVFACQLEEEQRATRFEEIPRYSEQQSRNEVVVGWASPTTFVTMLEFWR